MENRKFTDVYNELYAKSSFMNKLKKEKDTVMYKKVFVDLVLAISIIILYINIFQKGEGAFSIKNVVFWVIIFVAVILNIELANKKVFSKIDYIEAYKSEIIKPLIEECNKGLRYEPLGTDIENEYMAGDYEFYEIFFSEDCIYGNGFKMADIKTVVERIDDSGNKERVIVYNGLFSSYDLSKFVHTPIQILVDKGFDNMPAINGNKNKVLMDSATFEKYFDVYGAEKIEVMKLLTADVMEELVKIRQKNKFNIDIKLIKSKLFIRIHSGNIFEPSVNKSALDIQELKNAYDLVDTVIKLSKCLSKAIDETEL